MRHFPIIFILFLQIFISNAMMFTRSKSGIKLEQFENRINTEIRKIDEEKQKTLAKIKSDDKIIEILEKIQLRLVVIGDAIQMPHLSTFAEINVENLKELKDFLTAITADSASASSSSTTSNAFPLIPPTKMMAHFKGKFDNFLKDLQLQKAEVKAEDKAKELEQLASRTSVKLKIYKDWKQMKVQKPQTDTLKAKAELWKVLLHEGIVQFAASLDAHFKELTNSIEEIELLAGNQLENYWKLHWLEELAKACLELFEFLNGYNIKHNTANEMEAEAFFDNMDDAYTAVGKRLDWLLGRTEPKMAWEDVAIGHFMASQLRELLEEMCRPGGSERLADTVKIFPELTGHQYDYNNQIDRQEWRMFLLVGYILDLYYLEENYRYKTKMDEKVGGLDPEQARDSSSMNSQKHLDFIIKMANESTILVNKDKDQFPDGFIGIFSELIGLSEELDKMNKLRFKEPKFETRGEVEKKYGMEIRKGLGDLISNVQHGQFIIDSMPDDRKGDLPKLHIDLEEIEDYSKYTIEEMYEANVGTEFVIFQVENLRKYFEENQIYERLQHEYAILYAAGGSEIRLNSLNHLINNIEHMDEKLNHLLGLIKNAVWDFEKVVELEQKMKKNELKKYREDPVLLRISQFYKLSKSAIEFHVALQKRHVHKDLYPKEVIKNKYDELIKLLAATGVNMPAFMEKMDLKWYWEVYAQVMGRDYDGAEMGVREQAKLLVQIKYLIHFYWDGIAD